MQAKFIKGDPIMQDYTPSGAVSAGDIIVEGDVTLIAHLDIASGALGSVAAGGGEYEVLKDGTSGPVFSQGDKLYWDDSGNEAVASATSNTPLGFAAADAGTSDATVRVIHAPNAFA